MRSLFKTILFFSFLFFNFILNTQTFSENDTKGRAEADEDWAKGNAQYYDLAGYLWTWRLIRRSFGGIFNPFSSLTLNL